MEIHLVDGTYELFRHYFAVPSHKTSEGVEVAATRGVLGTLVRLLEDGATHVGVATDHVVESFRNDLFDGYKTGEVLGKKLKLLEEKWIESNFVIDKKMLEKFLGKGKEN